MGQRSRARRLAPHHPAPAQLEPPPAPTGQANPTDPDSRKVKATRGYLQGYDAQAVTTEQQIVIAAELTVETDVAARPTGRPSPPRTDRRRLWPNGQAVSGCAEPPRSRPGRLIGNLADEPATLWATASVRSASRSLVALFGSLADFSYVKVGSMRSTARLRHPAYLVAVALMIGLGVGHGAGVLGRELRLAGLVLGVLLLIVGEAASRQPAEP